MVKHYNTSISEDAARILNSKQGQFLGDDVTGPVAVVPISRYCNIVRRGIATGTSTTIYSTPSDKDFYIVAAELAVIKDSSSTSTVSTITVVIDGVSQPLLSIPSITLTAQNAQVTQSFRNPVKVDRGTNITVTNGTNVAVINAHGCIAGYTVETTK